MCQTCNYTNLHTVDPPFELPNPKVALCELAGSRGFNQSCYMYLVVVSQLQSIWTSTSHSLNYDMLTFEVPDGHDSFITHHLAHIVLLQIYSKVLLKHVKGQKQKQHACHKL